MAGALAGPLAPGQKPRPRSVRPSCRRPPMLGARACARAAPAPPSGPIAERGRRTAIPSCPVVLAPSSALL
eukprot:6252448-Pyramimonas_sp.AAC.1